jgi:hypothetical protein
MPKVVEILSLGIAVVALIFSVISFVLSYRLSHESSVTSVKPVLVFEYDGDVG